MPGRIALDRTIDHARCHVVIRQDTGLHWSGNFRRRDDHFRGGLLVMLSDNYTGGTRRGTSARPAIAPAHLGWSLTGRQTVTHGKTVGGTPSRAGELRENLVDFTH